MAISVALINMKGGVGKTTLATQIAWYAAIQWDKKVLLIDLDPQANASQTVMSPGTYVGYLDRGGLTAANLFEQFAPPGRRSGSPRRLEPDELIYNRVTYQDGSLLDLVPSRLELSSTLRSPKDKETLLAQFVAEVEAKYDLILIDCSPTDSILTDAAYHCARFILVPLRAEFLAAIGFPLLARSIDSFRSRHQDKNLEVCGLVFNDFTRRKEKREHKLARRHVKAKAAEQGWYVFKQGIPHSDSYFRAAREGMPIDGTKGTHGMVKREFAAFARELSRRIGL